MQLETKKIPKIQNLNLSDLSLAGFILQKNENPIFHQIKNSNFENSEIYLYDEKLLLLIKMDSSASEAMSDS